MLIYVTRNLRFIFPVALALNSVMLVSTFSVGGHYLADIGAGVIVGIVTIWLVRRWFLGYEIARRPLLTDAESTFPPSACLRHALKLTRAGTCASNFFHQKA